MEERTETLKATDPHPLDTINQGSEDAPRAFISYAWSDPRHQERVKAFADRLISQGIDTILDIYDNRPGHDLDAFMERVVTDPQVSHVLVISDATYVTKADGRQGGVGAETQLISREVYNKIDQEKIVPLIFERDASGHPCLPAYMKGRHYIDFSEASEFHMRFDELVRHIYGQPEHVKPRLGPRPTFEPSSTHPSASIAVSRHSAGTAYSAVENLMEHLRGSRSIPEDAPVEVDEILVRKIRDAQPYVADVLRLVQAQTLDSTATEKYVDFLDDLFCQIKSQEGPLPGVQSFRDSDYEHIGFLAQQIIVSVFAILVKNREYELIWKLVDHTYFYERRFEGVRTATLGDFYQYSSILDEYRNKRLELRRLSVVADFLKEFTEEASIVSFAQFVQADCLIYLLLRFRFPADRYKWWFPKTSVYAERYSHVTPPLHEMISEQRANAIAKMFGSRDTDDLLRKYEVAKTESKDMDYNAGWGYHVPNFFAMFPENLSTLP